MTRRRMGAVRALALLVLSALLLSGCVPASGGGSGDGNGGDTDLYLGAIPTPADLPPSPELPAMPKAPVNGDAAAGQAYNDALQAYSASYTSKQAAAEAEIAAIKELGKDATAGGEKGVAAWEALLVRAGIAVLGPDGQPLDIDGQTGFGIPMTDGELRIHSALAADPDGMRLGDVADLLSTTFAMTPEDLTTLLYTEITQVTDFDFAQILWAVGPGLADSTGKVYAPSDVFLDWAQIELLIRRLAAELVSVSPEDGAQTSSWTAGSDVVLTPAFARRSVEKSATTRPCESTDGPWSDALVNQANKLTAKFVFDKGIEKLEQLPESTGTWITVARGLASYITFAAKIYLLRASYTLSDAPLVRTKDTHPGEVRNLTIAYSYDPGKWQTLRECLNKLLAPYGFELPGTQPDPPSGIDVELFTENPAELLIGDGKGGDKPVDQDNTDGDGKAHFMVSGPAQPAKLPDKVAPVDLTADVRATNDLKGTKLLDDVGSIPWDAADAAETFGVTILPELISRTKFLTTRATLPVRDWKLDADFQVTAIGTISGRIAHNKIYACGSIPSKNDSTEEKGTFTTDPVTVSATLIDDPLDNRSDQAFVFVPQGTDFVGREVDESGVSMFPMPAHYTVAKSTASPGTGEMPDPYTEGGGCAGGGGGGYSDDSTPAPDCGARDYDATLQVTIPKPHTLYAAGDQYPSSEPLWRNCGDPLYPFEPVVAAWFDSCSSAPTFEGGDLPSMKDIADPDVTHFQVEGSYSCVDSSPGRLSSTTYTYTLDFCRLKNGKAEC